MAEVGSVGIGVQAASGSSGLTPLPGAEHDGIMEGFRGSRAGGSHAVLAPVVNDHPELGAQLARGGTYTEYLSG